VEGFTLPERADLERAAEIERLYRERFKDVWTPLTFRAPTSADINWRSAVASLAEAFTFWIPTAKGASALAASRGFRIPVLTTERTAAAARGVKLPRVPGDFFELHYVEPRKVGESVRGAFVGQGVGEGAAVRGGPGNWEAVFARAGQPGPGWAFEWASMTYRDVADWLKKLPSLGLRTELKPRVTRFTEVRGFAREFEPPRLEAPRLEPPTREPRGREVKIEWGGDKPPTREIPTRETLGGEVPGTRPEGGGVPETGAEGARGAPKAVESGIGLRTLEKVAQVEEELVRPVRAELPVGQPVRMAAPVEEGRGVERGVEPLRVETPVAIEVPVAERALKQLEDARVVEWPVEVPFRELGFVYLPLDVRVRDFAALLTYPFEARTFEAPVASVSELEVERAYEGPRVRELETPRYGTRTAEYGGGRADSFSTPPPPPYAVRGGYDGGSGSGYVLRRPYRLVRRGWRVYEALRL
jgi:hypothetical protein